MYYYDIIDTFRRFLYIREVQPNRGIRVEAIQHWSGGNPGDSWCCEMWWMINDIACQGMFVMPRVQAVQSVYDYAKQNGLLVNNPQAGDTFIYVDDNDHAHHIGVVTGITPLKGIAGNTSADGTSSNGDRVAEHEISSNPRYVKFIRFKQ